MNSELYSRCVEEATALLDKEPKHAQMRQLWYAFCPGKTIPPEWTPKFLGWLKDKVNEKVFHADGVADPTMQKGFEL